MVRTISRMVRFFLSATPFCCGEYGAVRKRFIPCCSQYSLNFAEVNSPPLSDRTAFICLLAGPSTPTFAGHRLKASSVRGDVISGTSSVGTHHSGLLEGWFGVHWWTGRTFVVAFTTVAVFAPLVSFKRIDSLKFTSALSVGLAVVFLVIAVGISVFKIIVGGIGMPRLFPIITDMASILELFTVVPVLVTAYICHPNVHPIDNELEDSSQMHGVVRTSLALSASVYLLTSFFGFLLFGEATLDDVLANFDTDLGIPLGSVLNDAVRFSYAAHLVLVFPVVFYGMRVNLDSLLFPSSRPLTQDNIRFASITVTLVAVIFLGANFIPSIWDIFQFTGATAAVCIAFIFPAAIILRDGHSIATKRDKILSVFMIFLAVLSNAVALYSDTYALIKKNKTYT
ncbi:hypothetical protein VIGAN_11066100 [Vigna angularis var. angularis]|uniref:Amino acid transporter transmembrane domain-containing protein n=1 Tax=Vigna angularis var. angularis TaxID=157739 RepID=A0A0S3T8T2_PHAAN|nr:hypothetical protein VIGAN_11066100 [Vigna angularis var. angularis]